MLGHQEGWSSSYNSVYDKICHIAAQTGTNLKWASRMWNVVSVGFWPLSQWLCGKPPVPRRTPLWLTWKRCACENRLNSLLPVCQQKWFRVSYWLVVVVSVTSLSTVPSYFICLANRAGMILWLFHSVHSFISYVIRTYHLLLFKKEKQDTKAIFL